MKHLALLALLGLWTATVSCSGGEAHDDHGHAHGPDGEHLDGEPNEGGVGETEGGHDEDSDHEEQPLGEVQLGEHTVQLSQGHGAVEAGKESHLVVKLPYSDDGSTIVRAWIGGEDRTLSLVGKGEYAPDHDDYDIHATAPAPLPEGVMWWVEVEQPDGTKVLGSIAPLLE